MTITQLARLEAETGVIYLINDDGDLEMYVRRTNDVGFNWPVTEKFGWDLTHATRQAKSADRVRVDADIIDPDLGFIAGLNVFMVLRGTQMEIDFLFTPRDDDSLYINLVVPQGKWQEFVDAIKDAILTHYPRAVLPSDFSLV